MRSNLATVAVVEPVADPVCCEASPSDRGRRAGHTRVTAAGRILALAIAVGCLTLLLLSAWLQPSPTGVGTHRGLGLQQCQWLATTGLPCPGCGMTTAFSWFVRGNAPAALWVQPMGAMIALLDAAGFWLAMYVLITAKPIYRLLQRVPTSYYLLVLPAWAIVAWGWKIYIHTHGYDGWS